MIFGAIFSMVSTSTVVVVVLLAMALMALVLSTGVLSRLTVVESYDPLVIEIRRRFAMLSPEYSKIPIQEGDASYTENKSVITLCLRDPTTNKPYDINTLMYVALHELAHVVTHTQDHTPEFKKKFAILLKRAEDLDIYDPKVPLPAVYCGVST